MTNREFRDRISINLYEVNEKLGGLTKERCLISTPMRRMRFAQRR